MASVEKEKPQWPDRREIVIFATLFPLAIFALYLVTYQMLTGIKFIHPAAFAAFFTGLLAAALSFLRTVLRLDLAISATALMTASICLATSDKGCETAMAMFSCFALLSVLWTATAFVWQYRGTRPNLIALLWRYGLPSASLYFAIGIYFMIHPIAR